MNYNRAIITGRLTRDPEGKVLPSGSPVTEFSVATSHTYKDKDGNQQEETEYHNVVVFGKQAENVARFIAKGQLVSVEGKLRTRSWEKDGQKQYRTEIVADRVIFGPKSERSPHQDDEEIVPEPAEPSYPAEELNPEDIPFN